MLALLFFAAGRSPSSVTAQDDLRLRIEVESLIESMDAESRVAQLFLLPVDESAASDVELQQLLRRYSLGGLVLRRPLASQESASPDTHIDADFQELLDILGSDRPETDLRIPSYVGLSQYQAGQSIEFDYGGIDAFPSQMAIAATWDEDHAENAGKVIGRRITSAGVNLFFGPSLDVLDTPQPGTSGDLGVRSFGGSPAWVGRMGRAFIRGLHSGGEGRLIVAAGSFPGVGSADRSESDEIAVVKREPEQVFEIDLLPFEMVMEPDQEADAEGQTDAIVTTQARFVQLQAQPDRPFGLDRLALDDLDAQNEVLARWRSEGGLRISPGLGQLSIRRYVDADLTAFSLRQVLREALMAGNDLLLLDGVLSAPSEAESSNLEDSSSPVSELEAGIEWLARQYLSDEALQVRIDDALFRSLFIKRKHLGPFDAPGQDATPPPLRMPLWDEAAIEDHHRVLQETARDALTQLVADADGSIGVPGPGERLLFIVDERPGIDCPACPTGRADSDPIGSQGSSSSDNSGSAGDTDSDGSTQSEVQPGSSEDAGSDAEAVISSASTLIDERGFVAESFSEEALRLYGPAGEGTARIRSEEDIAAISYADLKRWLQATVDDLSQLGAPIDLPDELSSADIDATGDLIESADWLIFAMREVNTIVAPSSDALKLLLRHKTTEIEGKSLVLMAFESPYHLDTSEVASLNTFLVVYDAGLFSRRHALRALFGDTAPQGESPVSVPSVGYALDERLLPDVEQSVQLEAVGWASDQDIPLGSDYRVRTSPIVDLNGNPVPDGTRIEFRRYLPASDVFLEPVVAETERGRAIALLSAERIGELRFEAWHAEVPLSEEALLLRVTEDPDSSEVRAMRRRLPVDWGILLLSLSLIVLAGVLIYGVEPRGMRSPTLLVRLTLTSLAWGLTGYLLVVAGGLRVAHLPFFSDKWPANWDSVYQAPIFSFLFSLIPVLPIAFRMLRERLGQLG